MFNCEKCAYLYLCKTLCDKPKKVEKIKIQSNYQVKSDEILL
jgi:radical SAM protein with 4Fe4S-binding SPASM domain